MEHQILNFGDGRFIDCNRIVSFCGVEYYPEDEAKYKDLHGLWHDYTKTAKEQKKTGKSGDVILLPERKATVITLDTGDVYLVNSSTKYVRLKLIDAGLMTPTKAQTSVKKKKG